ncbi:MAG: 16S rRNA (guanine(527)-N(7))-methyltransferase RsmG [Candidatus Eremiobacteraeota bacterium]|nr:16S rRNA (guanine(527)-N(7))-methyltransferase RsmG [Candidatus Eremiobacteraeota bacterium]
MPSTEEAIGALLTSAGVEARLSQALSRYGTLLLAANEAVNLTGASNPDLLVPHLLDSLTVAPYASGPVIDIGAGGGLPGIPVGIASGREVTLVEAIGKKAEFLKRAMDALALKGRVLTGRAEVLGHDPALRGRFSLATARAVGSGPTVAELTIPFLVIGGLAVLQRGQLSDQERQATSDAARVLGATWESEIPLAGDRRLIVLRKHENTPEQFPRRNGIPEKRPLCT